MVPSDRDNAILASLIRTALRALQQPTPMLERQSTLLVLVQAAMQTSAARGDARAWTERRRGSERSAVIAVQRYLRGVTGT